jgi:hypothetical protein
MLVELSPRRRLPGHSDRPTLISANPSYLGMLVEAGAANGMGPGDLLHPRTGAPARPGDPATIVATPLPPVRETTIVMRYDTEDVVTALPAELDCELRHQPHVRP